jgi:hypothetical protein
MLGAGLAVFGVGTAASAIGSFVGMIGDGWSMLTGSDSPIEKLKKFADQKITQTQVKQVKLNSEALKAYAVGMTAFGSGSAVEGIGNIVSGISSWFSDSPLEKLQEFANENINHTGLKKNLDAIDTFQTVFGKMSASGSAGTSGLKKLDVENVTDYADAIKELTEALAKMNEQLSKDNNGWAAGKGTNAGDILNQTNKPAPSNDVNTTALIRVLEEIKEINKRTLRAINESGNLY